MLALLLAWVPSSSAELQNPERSTPTTLYFHIFDTFNAFPINTQPMDVAFFEVGGTSFPTLPATPLGTFDFNTIYGFATSGPVEYDFIENGRPRFHPERGIAQEVKIDDGVTPVVHLYVEVRDFFSTESLSELQAVGWTGLPNALPAFTMRATMRTGNEVGPDSNLDAGKLIMQGSLTAHVLDTQTLGLNGAIPSQEGPDGVPILVPDEAGIVEFAIPMDLSETTIPKADAYNIRLDWFQNPQGAFGEEEPAEGYMRLALDQDHLPRLDLAILNPVYIEYIHPQVAAGTLLIHTAVNSPWGTYDVDVANITVSIEGPAQPQELRQVVTQNAHVHGLHDKAAEVTYLWEFRDEDAPNGDYTIRIAVPNLAHTATATGDGLFTVEGKRAFGVDESGEVVETTKEGGKGSPGLAPVLVLGALAAVAMLRRRSA